MKYIISLDQGTTSSRAIVFAHDGSIKGQAQKEFEQIFPRPGWVEHRPNEIWSTQSGVIAEAIANANIASSDIGAIGITNQRETTVVWNKETGEPVHNAIVWQDRRTAGFIDGLKEEGLESTFQKKTGLVLDAYFSGSKLAWILDNVEGARADAEAGKLLFGTIDSWLIYKLTGGKVHVTDVSNACRTMMFNIHNLDWDQDILDVLKVPRAMLPEVKSSSEVYGHASQGLLRSEVPIAGIAGDQQAASFGQACFKKGQGKNTYGTGCFFLMNMGQEPTKSDNKLLSTVAWQLNGKVDYALEGSIFIAGAVVQWLRDGLGIIRRSEDVEELALSVEDNGGVYLVPAFAGLGAPHWEPEARGAVFGLSRGTGRNHVVRATVEAVVYQTHDLLGAMRSDGADPGSLRVDGGMVANGWMVQHLADVTGLPVERPTVLETTAMGAAFLAMVGCGMADSLEALSGLWQRDRRFEPAMEDAHRKSLLEGWEDCVKRLLR